MLVIKNLRAEREREIGLIEGIRAKLAKINAFKPQSPAIAKERQLVVKELDFHVQELRAINAKLKSANLEAMAKGGGDEQEMAVMGINAIRNLRAIGYYYRALAQDNERRIQAMKEMTKVEPPQPAIPNDFETWRRECYDDTITA
jgi:hypothetical protein